MRCLKPILLELAALIFLFPFLFSDAFGDQAAVLTESEAEKTLALLGKSNEIRYFCAPCGDTKWESVTVKTLRKSPWGRSDKWQVFVNGKSIDLAYVYVKDGGAWKNLAMLVGVEVSDVPSRLQEEYAPAVEDPLARKVKDAEKLISEGEIESAIVQLESIEERPNRYFDAKEMTGRLLKRAHEVALKRYRAKDALGAASVMSLAFDFHSRWAGEGSRLEKIGRIPIPILIQNDYGFLLSEAGEHEAAEEVLRDVVSQAPDRAVARLNLADALWELGKIDEARKEYEAYAGLIPAEKRPQRVAERCPACTQ